VVFIYFCFADLLPILVCYKALPQLAFADFARSHQLFALTTVVRGVSPKKENNIKGFLLGRQKRQPMSCLRFMA
jgi:hypothetical protein